MFPATRREVPVRYRPRQGRFSTGSCGENLDLREVPGVTDVELTVVAGTFVARSGKEAELAAVLARYVVLTRSVTGCRNVDLMASTSEPGRFLMVEKWDDEQAQKDHLNGEVMVTM